MNAFSIIFADTYRGGDIGALSDIRSLAAVPFCGRYRLIDFMLSSMVQSNVMDVGIITKTKYDSLMDHLGSGKEWGYDRKNGGLKMITPFAIGQDLLFQRSKIEALSGAEDYLSHRIQKYAILADGNIVGNFNFKAMLDFHVKSGAKMTTVYAERKPKDNDTAIKVDENSKIIDARYFKRGSDEKEKTIVRIYVMERSVLTEIIQKAETYGWLDFSKDYIARSFQEDEIYAYKHDGYLAVIDTMADYYDVSMNLLNPDTSDALFRAGTQIITKIRDSVPVNYGNDVSVSKCLIADGCKIEGTVENSILFRGVHIKKGAVVKNSIILKDSTVEDNCNLDCAILDKNVKITSRKVLKGDPNNPYVVGRNQII